MKRLTKDLPGASGVARARGAHRGAGEGLGGGGDRDGPPALALKSV